jgi:hypothetical protein
MPRPKSVLIPSRIVLRLNERDTEILKGYTIAQVSEIMSKALSTIAPGVDHGINAPSVLRPIKLSTNTIARVYIKKMTIRVFLPEKVESFRLLANKMLYTWDVPFWERTFKSECIVCDRAAELCYRILELGIPVQIDYTGVRDKVVSGKFQIEPTKLIQVIASGLYEGWFKITWRREEDCYSKAISLTAAKYVDKAVIVPPEHFLEIEDFAEEEGFDFSESAVIAIEESKKKREIERLIDVYPIDKRHTKKRRKSSAEIPDHLKDDAP